MLYDVPHIIHGKHLICDGERLSITNPATGKTIGQLSVGQQDVVDQAVSAAQQAFATWSLVSPAQRAQLLFAYKSLLESHAAEIAALITQEHGKTHIEALGSLQRGIDVVAHACGITQHLKEGFAREVATGVDCYSIRQPIGVCAGITPFNFPAMIPLWMFPMAIACGNTFILKPSEKDPSCAVRLVELAQQAGIPDGVINVVQGDKQTVDHIITHVGVNAVSFVGSTVAAEHVYKTAIMHNKRAQAFGGAKNHCLVMPDADIQAVVDAVVPAAYGSAGERCMAISVVVMVGETLAECLVPALLAKIALLRVGSGHDDQVDMGPLVTEAHWERVQSYVALGKQEGATLLVDGSHDKPKGWEQGYFMRPCLFDHVKPSMRIYREEIFGPVLCLVRVPDFSTGLALINAHEYGNGTAIFTRDGYYAREFTEKVSVGMVGVNVPVPVPVAYQAFGGWKKSIFADIGMYGMEAVRFYTKTKTITERWMPMEASCQK